MKTLFIPCSFDGLPRDSGSIRLRAEWVCNHWDGAEVYDRSQSLGGWDLYVFQKTYLTHQVQDWIHTCAMWRDAGRCRLAFDLCDPDFLDTEHERRMSYMLPRFDFAVATTEPIAEYLKRWLPTAIIPDRVDLDALGEIAQHITIRDGRRRGTRAVWAGYDRNTAALEALLPTVQDLDLALDILTVRQPIPFDEFWLKVLNYDLLLNPRPDIPPFSYKSDNKTRIAWALGLPVARTAEELRRLINPQERQAEIAQRADEVREQWDVRQSVAQWRRLAKEWCK